MSTTKEMIAVMQAHADGEPIQAQHKGRPAGWFSVINPSWNWAEYDFRVKREPIVMYCVISDRDLVVETYSSLEAAENRCRDCNGRAGINASCRVIKMVEEKGFSDDTR